MSSKPNPKLYNLPFVADEFNGMPYLYLGNSGLRVSKVGLGTWKIGYPETGDGSRVDEKTAYTIFDRAIELGVTFWDGANRYNASSGNSERIIGNWLKDNPDMRRDIVLATKLFGLMDGKTPNHCRLSRLSIKESVYASLERLQADNIDLLYFHSYDPFTPLDETLEAVSDLISQDLVRYLGVSNYTRENLKVYAELAKEGFPRVVAVQNGFNLFQGPRENEDGVLEFCTLNNISFIAWGPLGQGLLTDRYLNADKVSKGDRLFDEKVLAERLTPENKKKLTNLDVLSREWGMPISEIALAYTLTLPGMGPVIPSASKIIQLEANARAGKVELSSEQKLKIEQAIS